MDRQLLHRETEFLAFDRVALRAADGLAFRNTRWVWRRGERWAILGPTDSGQTLLVDALRGLVPVIRGEIRGPLAANGADATADGEVAPEDAVAVVSPQAQRDLFAHESSFYQARWHSGIQEGQRTVAAYLAQETVESINPFELNPRRNNGKHFRARRREVVAWLSLEPLWRRKLVHLSNGEQRRVLLAHALLRAPRLLVLNDPYMGLDVTTRRQLRAVLLRLSHAGQPVLLLTHRVEEVPTNVTHLLLIRNHRVVAQGPKCDLLPAARALLPEPGSPRPRRTARNRAPSPQEYGFGADAQNRYPRVGERDGVRERPGLSSTAKPLVELGHVTVVAGSRRLLRDVTWTLRAGERWALLGPNGAGKTTLLNLIQGDHPQAYAQDLRLFGLGLDSTQALWQARRQMGWVSPELHQHYPAGWSCLKVVCSGFANSLGLYESVSRARRAKALDLLTQLGLESAAHTLWQEMEFGVQRLVLFARAIVKEPQLLILDEPCQGLGATHRDPLLTAVDQFAARTTGALVYVTHRRDELPRCLTHLLQLRNGRVTAATRFRAPRRRTRS